MPKSAGHAQRDDRHGGIAMNPRIHDGRVDAGRGQASPIRANAEGIGLSILSPRALGKGPLTRGEGVGPHVGGADFCGCLEGSLEKRSMAEGAKGARGKLGACAAGDPNKPVGWRLSLWLLSIASVCAVSSIVGYDTGWAHFHKDHYKPKTNTYLALVLTIMGDYPDVAEKIPANLVDIVKPLLPAVNISIDIQLGWLERTTILDLHSDELSPVITNFLEKPELDPYRDQIDQVAVDRRMVMRNFYKDTGVEAQWSGAISAALLAVSIFLSVSLFAAYAFTRASKGPRSVQCGRYCFMVMKLSTLLG
ncbi:unnamed protein product [Ostreobium quekettii]|uniref:Uncharacterized protein n=1 Tax=Ostreobium quekettii TaxID=121088 RepID=A0A8S1JEG2_9CHLO|nr:unnamed protein product [Ostreobium quekettii]|eukprot:evm.model.scf_141.3 EVM.evm.TU.scf_141.3   scf_141:77353-80708(+)